MAGVVCCWPGLRVLVGSFIIAASAAAHTNTGTIPSTFPRYAFADRNCLHEDKRLGNQLRTGADGHRAVQYRAVRIFGARRTRRADGDVLRLLSIVDQSAGRQRPRL